MKKTSVKIETTTQPKPSLTLAIYDIVRKKLPELAKKVCNTQDKEWNVKFGKKYAKITGYGNIQGLRTNSVWGFIVLKECTVGGIDYKPGDLLKAAGAKHASGNIMNDTAKYDIWGPEYLSNNKLRIKK